MASVDDAPSASTFKSVITEFANGTSGHGWGKISGTESIFKKAFWSLICLTGIGISTWQITLLMMNYADYPYTTKIEMAFQVQPFPAVTICNQNQFRMSKTPIGGAEFEAIIESYLDNMKSKMFRKPRAKTIPQSPEGSLTQQQPSGGNPSAATQASPGSNTQGKQQPSGGNPSAATQASPGSNTQAKQQPSGGNPSAATQASPGSNTQAKQQPSGGNPSATTQASPGSNTQAKQQPSGGNPSATTQASPGSNTQAKQQPSGGNPSATTQASPGSNTQAKQQPSGGNPSATTQASPGSNTQAQQQTSGGDPSVTTQASPGSNTQAQQQTSGGNQSVTTQASPESSTQAQEQTTKGAPPPPPPPAPKGRKRRGLVNVDASDALYKPTVNLSGMSWFENPGGKAASTENFRNLSVVIAGLTMDQKQLMGHQVDDMVQECIWSGFTCTPENFTAFYSRDYGNCFTFNSGDINVVTSKPGPKYGLSLTLLVEQDEYVKSLSPSAGLRVLIHRKDTQAFPEEDGIDISPGQKTSISLRRVSISRLPTPWGNCTNGTELTLMYNRNYSIPACVRTCLQNKTIETCGCGDPSLPLPPDVTYCKTIDELDCVDAVDADYTQDKFQCYCRQSCWDDIYQKTISSSEWPADSFRPTIMEQYGQRSQRLTRLLASKEGPGKHLLKLEVFFEELSYTKLTEVKDYLPENLFGDIGGQLGLWLGMSAITLIELIELVGALFKVLFCRKQNIGAIPDNDVPMKKIKTESQVAWS